jgi:hypothetical protein
VLAAVAVMEQMQEVLLALVVLVAAVLVVVEVVVLRLLPEAQIPVVVEVELALEPFLLVLAVQA